MSPKRWALYKIERWQTHCGEQQKETLIGVFDVEADADNEAANYGRNVIVRELP